MKKYLLIFLLLFFFASPSHAWWVAHGTYTADTGAHPTGISITGLPGSPSVVILKGSAATNSDAVIALSSMTATNSTGLSGGITFMTTCITSLDANGFTVGTHARCYANTVVYYWDAWGTDSHNDLAVGTYTGDGLTTHDVTISPAFQPALCYIVKPSSNAQWLSTAMSGAGKSGTFSANVDRTDSISQFNSDGFQVLDYTGVNTAATTYYYACWKANATGLFAGTWTCTTSCTDHQVTGFGFQPSFAWVKLDAATIAVIRFTDNGSGNPATDDSFAGVSSCVSATNVIQKFLSDGLELGTNTNVQAVGGVSQYVAFGTPTYASTIPGIETIME